jgi:hypothetical protein
MATKDLIEAAKQAKADWEAAKQAASTAAQRLRDCETALAEAELALHDDLEANGPAVVIDDETDPVTVYVYSAADPDTYSVKEIRVA